MKFSVSIFAEGDREITLEEVVELADAVAIYSGIATGAGTQSYGAQIIVDAPSSDIAVDAALEIFNEAVRIAKLPIFDIVKAETMSEDQDWEDGMEE
jgi:hypothetical protein